VGVASVAAVSATGAFGVSGDGTITTIAGTGVQGFSGDGGPATSAKLYAPSGVAIDGQGNVYIADTNNTRVRKVSPGGTISTFAGTGEVGFSGDGGPATSAKLYAPSGVAIDGQGNVYIADTGNNRVRKVSPGGTITTFAGGGKPGVLGDGGPATSATLRKPLGAALDGQGNVYIADYENMRVRKVSPGGTITTIAGTGVQGFSGDGGPAISAQLRFPYGVAVDGQRNIYIADTNNNRVRKVSPTGTITTFAGTGEVGNSGDGGPATSARLQLPWGVAVDGQRNVYIGGGNSFVRKVDPGGTISTFAGGGRASPGDGGPATAAALAAVRGVAVDGKGSVYFAEDGRVRKVTAGASVPGPVTGTPSGTVLVNGKPYTGGPIPYGSKVDVTKGKVKLKADVGTLTASGGGGITTQFTLLRRTAAGKPIVELRLSGGDFGACKKARRASSIAAVKPPKTVRRLWAKGKGSFRTTGKYASGTVRGTSWLTEDRCDGTFVTTRQGIVAVFDFVLKKTVLVKAGQSYLAKKP
jgi:hypothetical protein